MTASAWRRPYIAALGGTQAKAESSSFLKKRTKKLLLNWASGCETVTVSVK
jgi:hypothetical protein